jgi:hypothetical protein
VAHPFGTQLREFDRRKAPVVDHDDIPFGDGQVDIEWRHLPALPSGALGGSAGSPVQSTLWVTIVVALPSLPRKVTVSPPTK